LIAVLFNQEERALKKQLGYYQFPKICRYASQKNVFQNEVENLGNQGAPPLQDMKGGGVILPSIIKM
jgi:hypothetical protein